MSISKQARAYAKDKLWREGKEKAKWIKNNWCTRNEIDDPTERNIQKCMHNEMKNTIGEKLKKINKELGEPSNVNVHRRGR